MCALCNCASEKPISALLSAAAAICAGFLLTSCAGGFALTDKDGALIPVLNTAAPKEAGKAPNSDGNGALLAANGKRDGDGAEEQIVLGTGQFTGEPKVQGAEVTGDGDVELNFSEANVREVAQSVLGSILGQNVVVDAGVDQRITLRTSKPLKKTNLIPALETTLAAANLALIKDGELYRILPAAKARAAGKVLSIAGQGSPQPGYSVVAVRVDHIAASQMAKILEPLAPEKSVSGVDDPRNLLILAGTGPEMQSLVETIAIFDVSPLKGMSFGYFRLQHARAGQAVTELKEIIRAYNHQTGFDPPQIMPVERLNAVLVFTSHAENLKLVKGWVHRLDVDKNDRTYRFMSTGSKTGRPKSWRRSFRTCFRRALIMRRPLGREIRRLTPRQSTWPCHPAGLLHKPGSRAPALRWTCGIMGPI